MLLTTSYTSMTITEAHVTVADQFMSLLIELVTTLYYERAVNGKSLD